MQQLFYWDFGTNGAAGHFTLSEHFHLRAYRKINTKSKLIRLIKCTVQVKKVAPQQKKLFVIIFTYGVPV